MSSEIPSPPPFADDAHRPNTMLLSVLRAVFVLIVGAVGWGLALDEGVAKSVLGGRGNEIIVGFVCAALAVILLDIYVARKSLTAIAGLFFGLVVGMVVSYGLSLIIDLIVGTNATNAELSDTTRSIVSAVKLGVGVMCCYLAVSWILQTKDDIRFVIPYVEFAKERKGSQPLILDTSVIVDGRIADIANTRIIGSEMIVPRFVLHELQTIADSKDKLKRIRGRRGLEMLSKLQANDNIDIRILDVAPVRSGANAGVDEMLVDLALQLSGRVVTNDYNLNKIAQLRGVIVININDLANALKPVVLPGEAMVVKMIKVGEEVGQGIGYLEDGTMVVAEGGRDRIGEDIELTVTSVLQTSAGRMIFGRTDGVAALDRRRRRQ